MTAPVAIGMGSNLGERFQHLAAGLRALAADVGGLRCSSVYESAPMYASRQPDFLNACCSGTTELRPHELLTRLKAIEGDAGRRASARRFGPRELDLDLLLYGDRVIAEPDLQVPHPRMLERPFVLRPLTEVAGEWVHPRTGRTIDALAAQIPRGKLCLFADPSALERAAAASPSFDQISVVPDSATREGHA
jgi:2-amino-4-hydroxy-6-hydroxymethyldihydropteridine diphosphokinase